MPETWKELLARVRKENPGKALSECMKIAKGQYHKPSVEKQKVNVIQDEDMEDLDEFPESDYEDEDSEDIEELKKPFKKLEPKIYQKKPELREEAIKPKYQVGAVAIQTEPVIVDIETQEQYQVITALAKLMNEVSELKQILK